MQLKVERWVGCVSPQAFSCQFLEYNIFTDSIVSTMFQNKTTYEVAWFNPFDPLLQQGCLVVVVSVTEHSCSRGGVWLGVFGS